jgi:farnesyl diphosphate synthase
MTGVAPARTCDPAQLQALRRRLEQTVDDVNRTLDEILPRPSGLYARVVEAMRYAVFAGGKRLRPFLTLATAALFDVPEKRALRVGAGIEALHTYSLIHDDLPCMDDDDLRRGRPTAHRQFDEATAVLAGDALLTFSFSVLAGPRTHPSSSVRCELVAGLAEAAGSAGMIGGQMIDILAAERTYSESEIILMQALKTGALFEFSCEAGAILAEASDQDRRRLRRFARDLGLAFQITDDLIDVVGVEEQAGKAVGKDLRQGKATLVSGYGVDKARAEAARLANEAAETLSPYGSAAAHLQALPFLILDRSA